MLGTGFENATKSVAMFDSMGASLLASVRHNFRAQQAPDGTPWEPLKASTLRRKSNKKRGSAAKILRDTNRLYQSLTYQHDSEHAQVGANMKYARIHQHGGVIQRKAGSMPMYFSRNKQDDTLRRVKKGRANLIKQVQRGAYTIPIPARPYLYNADGTVPKAWKDPLVRIFVRSLRAALTAAAAGANATGEAN